MVETLQQKLERLYRGGQGTTVRPALPSEIRAAIKVGDPNNPASCPEGRQKLRIKDVVPSSRKKRKGH